MSITASLSSALSGLHAASRKAEAVSSNIANAMTEGYARRGVEVAARTVGSSGQGVQVVALTRATDPVLTADRRIAGAAAEGRRVEAGALARIEAATGTPGEPGALTTRLSDLEAAIVTAAGNPASESGLQAVADAANALAGGLSGMSDAIQAERQAADARIAGDVATLNAGLARVAELNTLIRTATSTGRDASALMDQRAQAVDGISSLLPMRESDRSHGQIALYTVSGLALLDGPTPASFGFTPTPHIVPEMTNATALSGLTVNGRAISTGTDGPLGSGALAANFAVRDRIAPEAQARLDVLALDLSERLRDPSTSSTAPGLFSENGLRAIAGTGLSGRLALNAALDSAKGGANWRLRDGFDARMPGPPGETRLLLSLQTAISAALPSSGSGASRSLSGLAADVASAGATARVGADREASFTAARAQALRTEELAGGVDTDTELQDLLVIEKAYAANAKVLTTVDEMLQLLLGI